MPRILILANENSTIYNFRFELLQSLVAKNYDVFISLPSHERNCEFLKIGCKIEEVKLSRSGKNPLTDLVLLLSYNSIIKRIRPDVVLTFTVKPNIYGSISCQRYNIPYINNVTGLGSMFQRENVIKYILLFLQKQAYKRSSCLFFQNKANLAFFKKRKVVGKKNRLLPGSGVNLTLNKYNNYPKQDGMTRFIMVSRVRKDKGFYELFDAIKILSKKYKSLEFNIIGWYEDSSYKSKIQDMVKHYPVIYHGNLTQEGVRMLLTKSHCLLHPSHHEGMSNAILEAAACGRPCIVSDIPGCREGVEDGISGYTFKVKDLTCLIEKIEKFIQLSYEVKEAMGIAGRKKMEREFDRNIVVNAYMEEIEKIISQKKGESIFDL